MIKEDMRLNIRINNLNFIINKVYKYVKMKNNKKFYMIKMEIELNLIKFYKHMINMIKMVILLKLIKMDKELDMINKDIEYKLIHKLV